MDVTPEEVKVKMFYTTCSVELFYLALLQPFICSLEVRQHSFTQCSKILFHDHPQSCVFSYPEIRPNSINISACKTSSIEGIRLESGPRKKKRLPSNFHVSGRLSARY